MGNAKAGQLAAEQVCTINRQIATLIKIEQHSGERAIPDIVMCCKGGEGRNDINVFSLQGRLHRQEARGSTTNEQEPWARGAWKGQPFAGQSFD